MFIHIKKTLYVPWKLLYPIISLSRTIPDILHVNLLILPHSLNFIYEKSPPIDHMQIVTFAVWDPNVIRHPESRFGYPINMPLCNSTGPVLDRCYQHRTITGPVLATNGMFTGYMTLGFTVSDNDAFGLFPRHAVQLIPLSIERGTVYSPDSKTIRVDVDSISVSVGWISIRHRPYLFCGAPRCH